MNVQNHVSILSNFRQGETKTGGETLIAENIKTLCKSKGITIAELERTIGLGNGTIRRWNWNSPSLNKVRKVAEYFGVSVDDLLAEKDSK